jgi:hypothetical protein
MRMRMCLGPVEKSMVSGEPTEREVTLVYWMRERCTEPVHHPARRDGAAMMMSWGQWRNPWSVVNP